MPGVTVRSPHPGARGDTRLQQRSDSSPGTQRPRRALLSALSSSSASPAPRSGGGELILPQGLGRGQNPPRALAAPGAAEEERKPSCKQLLARPRCERDAFSSKQRCPKFSGALRQADVGNSEESLLSLQIFIPPLFFSPLAPLFFGGESAAGAEISALPEPSPLLRAPPNAPHSSRTPKSATATSCPPLSTTGAGWDPPLAPTAPRSGHVPSATPAQPSQSDSSTTSAPHRAPPGGI